MKFMTMAALGAAMVLGACGGSGDGGTPTVVQPTPTPGAIPEPGSVTSNADGSFSIIQGSTTVQLDASSATFNGQKAWQRGFNGGVDSANSFINDNVTAIGGVKGDGTVFSGITGILAAAPSGDATFVGRYAVNTASGSQSGNLSMTYDLSDKTLDSVSGSTFVVDGDVAADGAITGTVKWNAQTADFKGGFYGDAAAGAFNNANIGGIFYGTN